MSSSSRTDYNIINNILIYLNKTTKFNKYIYSNFILKHNDERKINFYNQLLKIKDDPSSIDYYVINSFILNIYTNIHEDYNYYFENKIDKIKDYYYFINILSLYISELLLKYIDANLPIKRELLNKLKISNKKSKTPIIITKDIIMNNLNNIKIKGIYYLLFLFNLLLINNIDILEIYIKNIFNINTNTNISTDHQYYNIDDDIDKYIDNLKITNILNIDDNKLLFKILNLNLIISFVNTIRYDTSLLVTDDDDKKNIFNILKEYSELFKISSTTYIEHTNDNIYLPFAKYLYIFLNL